MDMHLPLTQALASLDSTPFHMPGHKRNMPGALPWAMDATEIAGLDNLQNPQGVLRELLQRAAALWGSRAAYLSVNGGTGAVLAAVRAMTQPGDTVLMARNCHMSVFHAAELCGLRPVFLEPEWLTNWGIYGAVAQYTLDRTLLAHPEATLCVITSPTYEGVCSELHCKIPLFVDAAHGAHLPLPKADLAAVSLHKTLPALTQTALLHVMSERVDLPRLEHQLRVFQTSSPSYVLMASAEQCIDLLERRRDELFAAWDKRLDIFYEHAKRWNHIEIFDLQHDRGKILIACDAAYAEKFLRQRRIEPEYAQRNRLLLMTSISDTDEMMEALSHALDELDRENIPKPKPGPQPPKLSIVNCQLSIEMPRIKVPAAQAIGRVCAEYVWEYPPGIPLLLPGQVIEEVPAGREEIDVAAE